MADRTSAALFATMFEYLAGGPIDERATALANRLFADTRNYDFNTRQMECDGALITLGLAKKGLDPDYPEDGERTLYRKTDGSFAP